MDELRNLIAGIVAEQIAQLGMARHAIVSAVNPNEGLIKVSWDEKETQSGWLPMASAAAGANNGSVTLPTVGTQVFVVPDMGDLRHGVVIGAVHSTRQPIPKVFPYMATEAQALVPGEPTIVSISGASMRFTDGGVVEIKATTFKIDGDLLVSGDISDRNDVHENLNYLRQEYNQHGHTEVMPGSGTSGKTNFPTP